jgi:pantoate kinase
VKQAKAFSPGGISSFFEICEMTREGNLIRDFERIGARGGGFGIRKGVATRVEVSESEDIDIQIHINGKNAPEAETTRAVARALLKRAIGIYRVSIEHAVEIPIGAGFGSSAGGALTTALALSRVLGLSLTYNQLGRIAHVAEVRCKTGLGTVGPLMLGGCILTLEPGGPGIAVIDRIPISSNYVIVAGVYGGISTKEILSSPEKRAVVNKWGRKTLDNILAEPSLENFLSCCCEFAEKTGFTTDRLRALVKLARQAGAIGAAQNMVGEAIHALTTLENAENVVQAFKRVMPQDKILVSRIDTQGARLVG